MMVQAPKMANDTTGKALPPQGGSLPAEAGRVVLRLTDLSVTFETDAGRLRAVDGVSFEVRAGRTLAIVGESGSGKSVSLLAVMGLLPSSGPQIGGTAEFDGVDLLSLLRRDLGRLRGNKLSMIFQEPMTSLNPSYTVGEQISEVLRRHRGMSRADARVAAIEMLRRVRIPSPELRYDQYPHKLSGGMRQRVMIAIALACQPQLLIADEPTTALDVTIQAQVLELLRSLREDNDTAVILITHDLGVVAQSADDVVVMYAGQVVERASTAALFAMPQHPYTVGLLGAVPRLGGRKGPLVAISGSVPDMTNPPSGCRFAARCPFRIDRCAEAPPLAEIPGKPGHASRCWRTPLEALAE